MRRILLCTLLVGLLYALPGRMNPVDNPLIAPEASPSVDFEVGIVPVGPGEPTGALERFENRLYCSDLPEIDCCLTTAAYLAWIGVHPKLFDAIFGEWSAAGQTEMGLWQICNLMVRMGDESVDRLRRHLIDRGVVVPGL